MKQQFILAILILSFLPLSVSAEETGLAGLHDWKKEKGKRICMVDHFHDGNGVGKTKKAAQAAAKQSWIDFTAFEYGRNWGSYKLSVSKKMDCQNTVNQWSCIASARPCKKFVKPKKVYSKSASR